MLKFFRHIRQRLLSENRFSKYALYAIGEIILVVIGILIALQINDWNQERLDARERNVIVNGLHAEFKQNKIQVQNIVKTYQASKNNGVTLMNYIGQEEFGTPEKDRINNLLDGIFPAVDYLPSNNAIEEIIQSGKLKNLKNAELSSKLSAWKVLMFTIVGREAKLDQWTFSEVIPYLNKYISWRDVGVVKEYDWATNGQLSTNYPTIFKDLEFENILENQIYLVNSCLVRYEEALVLIEEIITMTTAEK
ncbi:DUF6090 family protein [Croceiramulus getboli]|nr:DUF6090 family protein [Flavobacteriaceae bacterium YJPT1-3]